VAGKYFFKIALLKSKASIHDNGESDLSEPGDQDLRFLPLENWPVMLVKGEVSSGNITGTIRYGDYNRALYNKPIQAPGRVYAMMTLRLDPYTGQARPDLSLVDAADYFSATAHGHYEIRGMAPGIYDVYASAMGFPQTLIQHSVIVFRRQSLRFDGYLQPGPVIHGDVFSKHQSEYHPWPKNSQIEIELYDGPTLDLGFDRIWKAHKVSYDYPKNSGIEPPDGSKSYIWRANRVSWSPLPQDSGGQQDTHGRAMGPEDVGPRQDWFVEGGTTRPFHFEFGVKGEYGAPRDLDGLVPQTFATWVNGLTPGRYYVRAWVPRYKQSAPDGSTFLEYYFDATPNAWAEEVMLTIDLRA
jgi:hypothetical protein